MPLTVLVSVPLSSSGVLLGLFLTGRAFGLTAFIGLLMLVGIVVKNGILSGGLHEPVAPSRITER